jgi:hypothetical protein
VDGILGHSLLLSRAFLVGIPLWVGFEATTCCCLWPFSVGIPSWMGFSRPQLVVVSGLFLHDGIPTITKPFLQTFFFFHDGILAITKPFSRTFFLFSRWNSGYHEAFLTNFLSFFTMEF